MVFLTAGIQKCFSFLDPSASSTESIATEIKVNLTAPILLARLFLPHLTARASEGKQTNLTLTSSTVGFMPLGFYPVYEPSKAGLHAFCVTVRNQLGFAPEEIQRNFSLTELVPPYTDTDLDKDHRAATVAMQGGEEKAFPPMPLQDYMDKAWIGLNELDLNGKMKKEVGVGGGAKAVETWRGTFGKTINGMGLQG